MTTIRLPDGVHLIVSTVLADILDTAGIAGIAPGPDVVGRVRWLISERDAFGRERDAIAGALDAMRADRDAAVESAAEAQRRADTYRIGRDNASARLIALHKVIADFDPAANPGPDGWERRLRALLTVLTDERADLARRLEQAEDDRDALRTEPAGPVWDDEYLTIDGARVYWIYSVISPFARYGVGRVMDNKQGLAYSADDRAARKLAELLAGHDPGGRWTVAGHTVPVDVVRAVCGTVAVGWEAA